MTWTFTAALTPARLDVKASAADGLLDPVVRLRSCDTALSTTHDDDCLLGAADDGPDGSRTYRYPWRF